MREDLIQRIANALSVGADMQACYDILSHEGLDDYNSFLTYEAGKLLFQDRNQNNE